MNHSFDIEVAQKYGVDEAILIQNLVFWITRNAANEKHFIDGRTWTYNSAKAFSRLFPYWSEPQIRRIIDRLVEKKVIIAAYHSEDKRDRTRWFAFVDEQAFGIESYVMHVTEPEDGHVTEPEDVARAFHNDARVTGSSDIKQTDTVGSESDKAKECLSYLNEKAGRKFQDRPGAMKLIRSRLKEVDFDVGGIKKMIDRMISKWANDENMFEYLRPQTLFGKTKFEGYYDMRDVPVKPKPTEKQRPFNPDVW